MFVENQEMEDNMRPPVPPVKTDDRGMCVLSRIIISIGAIEMIVGGLCAIGMSVLYLVCGIVSGIFSFALAVIVDACQKYRESL